MDSTSPSKPLSYPLQWPTGRPRTREGRRIPGRYMTRVMTPMGRSSRDIALPEATQRVRDELELLHVREFVLSTNIPPSKTSPTLLEAMYPTDPGACLFFDLGAQHHAIPCDVYTRVEQNVAAIAAHLSALRELVRHGIADLRALMLSTKRPDPDGLDETWRLAHRLMTRQEYDRLNLKGWHMVCHDIDGCGGTGVRYLDQPPKERPIEDGPPRDIPDAAANTIPQNTHPTIKLPLVKNEAAVVEQSEFEILCGDDMVASAGGPRDLALAEARHYAAQYASEGTVTVWEVTRKQVSL